MVQSQRGSPETNNQERIEISDINQLKEELGVQNEGYNLDLRHPILVARQELRELRNEITSSNLGEREERIKIFIDEKTRAEERLSEVMADGTIEGIISSATKDLRDGFNEVSNSQGIGKIDKLFSILDKTSGVPGKITLGILGMIWKYIPSLAKFFGLKNPAEEIASQLKSEAETARGQLSERTISTEESIQDTLNIPRHRLYGSIYFRLFSSSNELDKTKGIDSELENNISKDLLMNEYFLDLNYNQLTSNENEVINNLYENLRKLPNNPYGDKDIENIKRHIGLVIKSITGGKEYYSTGILFWKNDKNEESISRGNDFLKNIYQKEGKDLIIENPSIKEIFSKLDNLKEFEVITLPGFDLEETLRSAQGSISGLLSQGPKSIAEISDIEFTEIKDNLPGSLRNINQFRLISTTIMSLNHEHRTLNNGFLFDGNDSINESNRKEEIESFIGNENEGLIKFGNEIYETVFKGGNPVKGLESIQKKDLDIKAIYRLYITTGGRTDIDNLDPIRRLQITTLLLIGFSNSSELGRKLGEITRIDGKGGIEISDDVKNILNAIGSTSKKLLKKAAREAAAFGLGFAKENPPLAAGLILVLWKFPFLTKRQSVSDVFRGR